MSFYIYSEGFALFILDEERIDKGRLFPLSHSIGIIGIRKVIFRWLAYILNFRLEETGGLLR